MAWIPENWTAFLTVIRQSQNCGKGNLDQKKEAMISFWNLQKSSKYLTVVKAPGLSPRVVLPFGANPTPVRLSILFGFQSRDHGFLGLRYICHLVAFANLWPQLDKMAVCAVPSDLSVNVLPLATSSYPTILSQYQN